MKIGKNEIHIYKFEFEEAVSDIAELTKLLSGDEIQRSNRFRFQIHRNRFIAFRSQLRRILSKYLLIDPSEISFRYAKHGKPFIEGYPVRFNLAHTEDLALYAVSDYEVGVDVEFIRPVVEAFSIARRYFSDEEFKEIAKAGEEGTNEVFFNCWTRKEAFIKGIGDGLTYPLSEFSVLVGPGEELVIRMFKGNVQEGRNWKLMDINAGPAHAASIAIRCTSPELIYMNTNSEWSSA